MSKKFVFLTGSTGLLGSYILRNLLRRREKVALLVRPGKKLTAEQRIGKMLDAWERFQGESLPRPLVFSGSLQKTDWFAPHLSWFADSCHSIIHCGASLTFYGAPDAEPWISNIQGTRRILELCQAAEIRNLHYFSTAYVAGSSPQFFENDLQVGQTLRNDYEQSKFDAETLVRAAKIDSLTVYRPSIVVGDSETGYTSTFHGFYAVLKLAHTLVRRLPLGSTNGRRLLSILGMNGGERKNFVPVDWVADVFQHVYQNRDLHGKTYHLTSSQPPSLADFVDVVQDAVETFSELARGDDPQKASEDWFFRNYLSEVQIYRAYLQDDPQFDCENTQWAAPHLPCPVVDRELMLFLARYAILSQFGKRKDFVERSLVERAWEERSWDIPQVEGGGVRRREMSPGEMSPGKWANVRKEE